MTSNENALMIWQYRSDAWTSIPDPVFGNDDYDDYDEVMSSAGFTRLDSWGFGMPSVDIYQHGQEEHWRVDLFTGDVIRTIEVLCLPDFLAVLAKLAPMETASLLNQVIETMSPAIFNIAEDARAESKRRNRR